MISTLLRALLLVLVLSLALGGCSDDDAGVSDGDATTGDASEGDAEENAPPELNNLSYEPETVALSDEPVWIVATFSGRDPGRDMTTYNVIVDGPGDNDYPFEDQPLPDEARADVVFPFQLSFGFVPTVAGEYRFEIWIVDAVGEASNRLSGTVVAR